MGIPIIRIIVYWGPPILENYQIQQILDCWLSFMIAGESEEM